ncbi:nitroreductase/quinone reductase family protein [Nocardia brasiliensis]|uniref:nitroreductase/quinone reductase family protein n=1 Tax=Nocardia brasiliensis TaxID=37326 RepID=UPI0018931ADE|nr:nitroreductase/quinone reductase family protein [Nocardia brasiliensis]MBF6543542.1 nitroreductase family deazaflavin-dependent oxidoreductase [Nocardia brasiliensis]
MQKLTVERVIAAPIETVFNWFADTENYSASQAVLQNKLIEPAADVPYGVGAVRKVTWFFGRYTERITTYDAPRKIGWVIESGFPAIRHQGAELNFSEVAGGTRVVLTTTAEAAIPFGADFATRTFGFPVLAAGYRSVLKTAEVAITSPRKAQQRTRQGWLAKPRNYIFDQVLKLIRNIHHLMLKVSGGKWGNKQFGMAAIELHVLGRKSKARRTAVLWVPVMEPGRVVLVASKEGDDRDPEWYKNLVATPEVELTIDGVTTPWLAHTADRAEKAELWPRIVKAYHGFAVYQTRTDRDIPVVVCVPREDVGSAADQAFAAGRAKAASKANEAATSNGAAGATKTAGATKAAGAVKPAAARK